MGGLPEGPERRAWQEQVVWQAMRLREYRTAFVGWTHFFKWAALAFIGVAIFGVIAYPPLNKPGEPPMWGPADYMLMLGGLLTTLMYFFIIGSGADFLGRTPRQIIIRRRVREHDRRLRKLKRIEKERARRVAAGEPIRSVGSRLGFSTQMDALGGWASDRDLRLAAKVAGFSGSDIAAQARADARKRGVKIPRWPELETSVITQPPPRARILRGAARSPRLRR